MGSIIRGSVFGYLSFLIFRKINHNWLRCTFIGLTTSVVNYFDRENIYSKLY